MTAVSRSNNRLIAIKDKEPKLLSRPDRLFTITTIALSLIALAVGVLACLQIHNVVNFGGINILPGANVAYITTAAAMGVILLSFVKLAIQQTVLVKHLRSNTAKYEQNAGIYEKNAGSVAGELEELRTQLGEVQAEAERLGSNTDESQIAELEKQLQEKSDQNDKLNRQTLTLTQEKGALTQEIARLEAELKRVSSVGITIDPTAAQRAGASIAPASSLSTNPEDFAEDDDV